MATSGIPPVPPLPPELLPLARWLESLRQVENAETNGSAAIYINVKDYGAKGDGATNDYASIQAAMTYATTYGGTVFFPAGTYICNSALVMDTGTSWAHYGPRCNLKGAGSANTRIRCNAANIQFLTLGGFGAQYHIDIDGLTFQGPGFVDNTGQPAVDGTGTGTALRVQASSDMSIRNCVFSGWGTGMNITDSFLILMENVYVTANLYGIQMDTTIYAHPNAITFIGCAIGGNTNYAISAKIATTINMHGGSIEGNGNGGSGSFVGGIYVSAGTDGVATLNLNGVYFEGNSGIADVYIDGLANSSSSSISGCTFNRIFNTAYVTNNIVLNSASGQTNILAITGCGFGGFNTYVPSASRPYILTTGAGTPGLSWMGCYFNNAIETPLVSGNAIPNASNFFGFLASTSGMGTTQLFLSSSAGPVPGSTLSLGNSVSGSASAGGATLPTNPATFLILYAGTTQYKIPLYNS